MAWRRSRTVLTVALARAEASADTSAAGDLVQPDRHLRQPRRRPGPASIDRLAVTYTTPDLVVRVGRQAITWGSGLVFRPMDLFDPFSPTATDTECKPGVDMLYVQRLFADGSDLQFILAPRPAREGGPVTADASSAALHVHTTVGRPPDHLARRPRPWRLGRGRRRQRRARRGDLERSRWCPPSCAAAEPASRASPTSATA